VRYEFFLLVSRSLEARRRYQIRLHFLFMRNAVIDQYITKMTVNPVMSFDINLWLVEE